MADSTLGSVKGNATTVLQGHTRTDGFGADAMKQRTGPGTTTTDLAKK
jgi:hypothetical protein